MKAANEARVGIVVLIALILMVVGYFYLRNLGLASDKYYVRLVGATNIAPGNEVRLQGVKIGQIQSVDLDAQQKPVLTLAIKRMDPPLRLLRNYRYSIQTSSLLGENYLDIQGRFVSDADAYQPNTPGDVIPATATGQLSGVTDQATEMIADMRVTLSKVNVTLDRINKGVLSYENQTKLARALEGVARMTNRASENFGPGGIKIGFGDPRAQRGLADTLQNSAVAARQASLAANDLRLMAADLRGVVGSNKGQINTLFAGLNRTANEVAGLAESLSFLVKNGGLRENLNGTLTAARRAAENVESMTANLKSATGDPNSPNDIKATLAAARRAAENVEAATAAFKAIADPETQKGIRGAIVSLTETAAALKDTAQSLKATISDPEAQKQLKSTLATINTASASLAVTMKNFEDVSGGLKNVIGDEKLQNDLKSLPGDLRASTDELRKTLAAARGTAESFQTLADNVSGLLPRRNRRPATDTGAAGTSKKGAQVGDEFPTGSSFTLRNLSNFGGAPRVGGDVTGNTYGDITFDANLFGGPFRLGASNIGDGTDITVQTGRYMGKNVALRYGVYRSQLGAGVELRKGRFFAESNLWNLNNSSYNAIAGVRVTPQVEVFAGRESIRGVRANAVGVRLRP